MAEFSLIWVPYFTLEFIIFILSVFGNLIIIYIVTTSGKSKEAANQCIVNVAVADFVFGLTVIPAIVHGVSNIFKKKFLHLK